MLSVGIFTGYYPYDTDEVIRRIKNSDFSCVQLDVSFKDCDAAKGELTKEKAVAIRNKLRDANLPAICVSGYTNFIHPDKEKRRKNIEFLKLMIGFAGDLGCTFVASETGTYNEESDWVWDDRNASEEVYQETLAVVRDIVSYARERGVTFLIENYVNNVIGSVAQVKRLFADVDSKYLGLVCDPTNYFDDSNIDKMDETLREIFDELAPFMRIAHAKDCIRATDTSEKHADIDADESHTFRGAGGVELPAAGLGVLNYPLYLELLAKHHPNMPLIIEHLDEGDIARAKSFVDGTLKDVGA